MKRTSRLFRALTPALRRPVAERTVRCDVLSCRQALRCTSVQDAYSVRRNAMSASRSAGPKCNPNS